MKFAVDVMGMFDPDAPFVHIHRPAGTWELSNPGALAKPSPWEGLL